MTGRGLIPALLVAVLSLNPVRLAAADLDSALAAYNRGDYELAVREWTELAENGDAVAQNDLGWMYEYGLGVAQDYKTAAEWYRKSAEQSSPDAQNNLGEMYYRGLGVKLDYVEAVRWYRMAAEQGNSDGQNGLGMMYEDGKGVAEDYKSAREWYRKSADQGNANAQNNLGFMYESGHGVSVDYKEAIRWYRKSAEQGNAWAQNNIGALYEDGTGVARDYAAALSWYRKAAAQGNAVAERNIGDLYHDGNGIARDYSEAANWYRKAAEQGDAEAQYSLATMIESGLGVGKDKPQALSWYHKAAGQGQEAAEAAWTRLTQETATAGAGETAVSIAPSEPNFDLSERKVIQQHLSELGFYAGSVDGSFGPRTRDAIRAFQRGNAMEASGSLTTDQAAALAQQATVKQAEAQPQQVVATTTGTASEQTGRPLAIAIPDDLEPIDRLFTVREPLNVRTDAKLAAEIAATLAPGDSVTILGKVPGKNWYLVGKADAPLGYVANIEVDPSPATAATATGVPKSPPEATLAAATAAYAEISFGRYHALVIGNDNYKTLPQLRTAVQDAMAVADVLQHQYDFEVETLVNATRGQIIASLSTLRKRLTAGDNLLIYYAGHGVYDEAADRGYWLPVDADGDVPANWVSNADITDEIKAMQAMHVLIVADSCYSGTLTRGLAITQEDAGYVRRMVEKRGRMALTSGGLEPVLDSGGGGHSVFARAFIDALMENTGVLDGQKLFALVREPVTVNSEQTPEYGIVRFAGHDGGDFIFVRRH